MATINRDLTANFQTTKDGDVEQTHFKAGDSVTLVQIWDAFVLIKDDEGHFYNLPKDAVEYA